MIFSLKLITLIYNIIKPSRLNHAAVKQILYVSGSQPGERDKSQWVRQIFLTFELSHFLTSRKLKKF
jgi:hypothetical protein